MVVYVMQIREDWKYIALVVDRLFLWIFTLACVSGTFSIIFQTPTLFDNREPIVVEDQSTYIE